MNDELPWRLFLFLFFVFCIFLAFFKGTFLGDPGRYSY